MASKLLRDCIGSSLIEFTIVFPIFILIVFGTIDVTYMLYDWALASKAAYAGAHEAILTDPVAAGITDQNNVYEQTLIGDNCYDASTGTNSCPSLFADCTATASGGTCTCTSTDNGCLNFTAFDNSAFTTIFDKMKKIFTRLQRQNVEISYATGNLNLGFVGDPYGVPMTVTVSIQNMRHQIFFLSGIIRFFGGSFAANPLIPRFATTLTSEDLITN